MKDEFDIEVEEQELPRLNHLCNSQLYGELEETQLEGMGQLRILLCLRHSEVVAQLVNPGEFMGSNTSCFSVTSHDG